ncbi:hypothetical protein SAMN04488126_10346 [Bhargavaea beijingensis]|uniref:Uncharacterized protein n=1 Tax=Bhargavaea beijingensis TaxID=426756 RepID=A0A1G6ZSZ5_9BACL|nr:hypothetical protein SAMN04488126_10346 [Bhargavaea beijingensis]
MIDVRKALFGYSEWRWIFFFNKESWLSRKSKNGWVHKKRHSGKSGMALLLGPLFRSQNAPDPPPPPPTPPPELVWEDEV